MKFKYETLALLRENTLLDPISYLKVLKERKRAINHQNIINEKEHCNIPIDFSKANQLEYDLRFNAWKKKIGDYWLEYHNNIDLDEFATYYLNDQRLDDKPRLLKKLL